MSTVKTDNLLNVAGTKTATTDDLIDGRCTAWVTFNGTTPTITGSMNVLSVTDLGVGSFRINFTNPMANTSYVAVCQAEEVTGGGATAMSTHMTTIDKFTTSIRIINYGWTGGYYDSKTYSVAIFGGV